MADFPESLVRLDPESEKELNPLNYGVDKEALDDIRLFAMNMVELNLPMKESEMKELSKNFLQLEMQGMMLERLEKKLMQILQQVRNQELNKIVLELQKKIGIYESELKHISLVISKEEEQAGEKNKISSERSSASSIQDLLEEPNRNSASLEIKQPQAKRAGLFSLQKSMIPIKKKEEICFPVLQNTLKIVEQNILCNIDALADKILLGLNESAASSSNSKLVHAHEYLKNEIFKFDQVINFFPKLVKLDSTEIFCSPSENEQWRELGQVTVKKDFYLTRQSIEAGLRRFHINCKIAAKALTNKIDENIFLDLFKGFQGDFFRLEYHEQSPTDLEKDCIKAFNIFQSFPELRKRAKLLLPSFLNERNIYIYPEFTRITKEKIMKEYLDGAIRKFDEASEQRSDAFIDDAKSQMKDSQSIFEKSNERIKIRIFSFFDYKLLQKGGLKKTESILMSPKSEDHKEKEGWFKNLFSCCGPRETKQNAKENISKISSVDPYDNVILHFHGGYFVSGSPSSHQSFLRKWAVKSRCPIFSVNYKLAPRHPYPSALDDCWQAYNWVISQYEKVFDRKLRHVILVGDGAGANLALGVCLLAAKKHIRKPNGLMLISPILNLDLTKISASHLLSIQDQFYSSQVIAASIRSYIEDPRLKSHEDPFLSPLFAPDNFLLSLPVCSLIVGECDPNYHDCVKFAKRLNDLGKDIRMIIYKHAPHGFLNYGIPYGVPEFNEYIEDAGKVLSELVVRTQIT